MSFSSYFHNLWKSIEFVFGHGLTWAAKVASFADGAVPILEGGLAIADPPVAAIVTPVMNTILGKLDNLKTVAAAGKPSDVTALLTDIENDIKPLESVASIKDPETQAKVAGIVTAITTAIQELIANAPSDTAVVQLSSAGAPKS
jgi:hypothetical protein